MSNLASTSRAQMRYILETAFGVTPLAGNPRNLRMTGESLDFTLTKETSKEIRSDRQLSGATVVDAASAGDISIHMQYGEYDPLIEAALMSSYVYFGVAGVGATFAAAYTATTVTAAVATAGVSIFTALKPGQWTRIAHPGSLNNGKLVRVSTTVAPTATVLTVDASTPLIVEASSAGAVLQASRLTNGVFERSFTFEKQLSDVNQFFAYRGQYVGKLALKFASAALLDGTISLMGKDGVRANATTLPGAPIASQTFEIQNAVTGVGQLWEGATPITDTYIKTLDLTIDNNLRSQGAIANLGAVGIGVGDFAVTGSFQAYFANGDLYDKFRNSVYTALTLSCQDVDGNGYVFTLPRVQLMTAKVVTPGKNADVMADFTFTAFADDKNANAALQKTLIVDRIGSAVI